MNSTEKKSAAIMDELYESDLHDIRPSSFLVSVDPGNLRSGWALFDRSPSKSEFAFAAGRGNQYSLVACGKTDNGQLRKALKTLGDFRSREEIDTVQLVVETPRPRGMPVSAETMETVVEIGRLMELWGAGFSYVFRADVKLHLCGVTNATDSNIRQAVIDNFGGDSIAIGGKKCRRCKGQGWLSVKRTATCLNCNGAQTVDGKKGPKLCPTCKGKGETSARIRDTCELCKGTRLENPPGPLHGVTGTDMFAAIALGLWWIYCGEKPQLRIVRQHEGANGDEQEDADT